MKFINSGDWKIDSPRHSNYPELLDDDLRKYMRSGDNWAAAERLRRIRTGTTDMSLLEKKRAVEKEKIYQERQNFIEETEKDLNA